MPIIKSAKKALRRDQRRVLVNRRIKERVRAALKKARAKGSKKNLALTFSLIDRAVKKKVIHRNKAARIKSRLMKRLMKKD